MDDMGRRWIGHVTPRKLWNNACSLSGHTQSRSNMLLYLSFGSQIKDYCNSLLNLIPDTPIQNFSQHFPLYFNIHISFTCLYQCSFSIPCLADIALNNSATGFSQSMVVDGIKFGELILQENIISCLLHDSKSWSQPPTRRALRRINRGVSDRSWTIRAKRHIESLKNSEKITTNLKKCRHQYLYITCLKQIT